MLRSLASRFLKLPRPLQAVPVIVVAAALWWAWPAESVSEKGRSAAAGGPGGPGGPRGPVPVRVAQVVQADFAVYEKALGTVTALNTVNVRARVGGELVKVLFEEGQMVKAGQLLAQIDPRPYEVAVQQAEGTLLQNQAQLKNAEIDLARYRGLYAEQSIAKQTLDTQQALVGQYQGTLKSNQATLAEARLNLQFSQIKAPISGRVGLRQLDAGNLLAANDSTVLAVITQTQPIAVAFTLPEGQVPALRAAQRRGAQLLVEAWDRNEQNLLASGTLHSLDNQIDSATGTLKLKAQFANADEALFPNQFVNVRLRLDVLPQVLLMPTAAVQFGSQGNFAFVVGESDKVRVQRLELGASDGRQTVVLDGLKAGERVILEGTDRLREGDAVDVIDGLSAPADPSRTPSGERKGQSLKRPGLGG
ncbi:multidrug transporter subunit MdtA [Pseudomonas sp. HAR-UPW-AIA-41]|uniref:MdtA/MuxA family multidrug efflux RND transporter periplasmic adaptor subunit n=1 Tax=Pseudomonas sp. HAR-UPW-AIA-41 TaxID=1985301 RepID=UPI000BB32540|nr:MdtA/MuxA family multidrug efflux RND transporter periplasmic adaptor subunit [Pseudomonas sp. HAR-UPW-AIA-41]PAV47497.1 multidrug transporter subunit MdtA [Pseudomonas sp. HAR-UPW-AIA-41]